MYARTRNVILIIGALFGVLVVAGQLMILVTGAISDRNAHVVAEAWLHSATESAKGDVRTKDDAIRWLKKNGANDVGIRESVWMNNKEISDRAVVGSRILRKRGIWTNKMTAVLEFRFDDDWGFKDLVLETLPY
jgi:hypothetical protein